MLIKHIHPGKLMAGKLTAYTLENRSEITLLIEVIPYGKLT